MSSLPFPILKVCVLIINYFGISVGGVCVLYIMRVVLVSFKKTLTKVKRSQLRLADVQRLILQLKLLMSTVQVCAPLIDYSGAPVGGVCVYYIMRVVLVLF